MFNRGNLIASVLLILFLGVGATADAQDTVEPALTLTVTNTSEDINGDITSPVTLLANPGADGISLPEALNAVQANTGAHETINFDPSLSGTIILLTQSLPWINRDGLTLDGDIDKDGVPDITIAGGGMVPHGLLIHASDVIIENLHFRDFTWSAIEIRTIPDSDTTLLENLILRHNILTNDGWSAIGIIHNRGHAIIRNMEISDNTFQNNLYSIRITAGFEPEAIDNEISSISILSNTLQASGPAVGILLSAAAGANISHNSIRDVLIQGNTLSGHTNPSILIDSGAANCSNNLISQIIIAENRIDGTPVTIEMVSVGENGTNASGNQISNVTITDNFLTGGGIQFGGASGNNSHDNTISQVLMDRNHIYSCAGNGISLYAGTGGAYDNLLQNMILRNTLIEHCNDAGVLLHGDDYPSQRNVISNITITNLTLLNNGVESEWAGGILINTLNSSNTITGVTIANTILWNNGGRDAILGSLAPTRVMNSRLNDMRFVGSNGNFNLDPGFVNPSLGNYHLDATSPCVDSGDPFTANSGTLDLDGNPRLWDGNGDTFTVVDRGAYEFYGTPPLKSTAHPSGSQPLSGLECLPTAAIIIISLWFWVKRHYGI